VKSGLSKDKTLIGFCGGPWTVATYMIEGKGSTHKETAKRFAYEHPQAMQDLLEALIISSADYLIEQARAGADVLKIFESWAEGLSPTQFETLVIEPTHKIISRIRKAGIISALAVGTDTSLEWARKQVGPDMALQGNLDPLALRIGGSVLQKAVQNVLDDIEGLHR